MLWNIRSTLLISSLLMLAHAHAEEFSGQPADLKSADISMVETEDERCVANDGKMISLEAKNLSRSMMVWVDRWFMEVQTADHTRQILSKEDSLVALGCSNTYSGPQRWTIYSVTPLE